MSDLPDDPFSVPHAFRCMWFVARRVRKIHSFSRLRIAISSLTFARYLWQPKIFIIGAPRSGTTFLGDAISAIPSICYFHEPENTKCAVARVFRNPTSRVFAWYYTVQYAWLCAMYPKKTRLFVEKTPRNCFIIDFLARTFPNSRFIIITRDGRDSAISNARKSWLDPAKITPNERDTAGYYIGSTPQFWVEPDRRQEFSECSVIKRCAWVWRKYTFAALESAAQLQDSRVLSLRYEKIVSSPDESAECISRFIDLQDEAEIKAFTAALRGAHDRSVGSASRDLEAKDLQQIEAECGDLLSTLGYEPSSNPFRPQ